LRRKLNLINTGISSWYDHHFYSVCHLLYLQAEIQQLFKNVFKITQDTDFITHIPAFADDIHAFEYEDGPGPDPDNLAFNLVHGATSLWNSAVLEILLCKFQKCLLVEKWLVTKPDNYIRVDLQNQYKKLHTMWLREQHKLTCNGVLETRVKVEARQLKQMAWLGKESQQAMCHQNIGLPHNIIGLLTNHQHTEISPLGHSLRPHCQAEY